MEKKTVDVIKALVDPGALRLPRHCGKGAPLPSNIAVGRIVALVSEILFPGYFGRDHINGSSLTYHTGVRVEELEEVLGRQICAGRMFDTGAETCSEEAATIAARFIGELPGMRRVLLTDAEATRRGDPAATDMDEVILCYPGFRATMSYRIAHSLHLLGVPVIPRMITEQAHSSTGIDIHPAATIGGSFMIDHGTGVVIGQTTVIGNNVKLYQGVTLGAKSQPSNEPRHPVIGNDVVIYSNTSVLGRITIGDGAVIGGNLWVTEDVAAGEKLVQARPTNILRFK